MPITPITLRRRRRALALALVAGLSVASVPLAGMARAADPLPAPADPLAAGGFCEDVARDNPFTDLGGESPTTRQVILCLVGTGLTKGTTRTTFTPGGSVTRRQMALFIKRSADLANELEETSLADLPAYDRVPDHSDVLLEDPEFQEAIGQLTQAGIVEGFPDRTFRPGALVSRRQMAAFVNRLQDHLTGSPFTTNGDYFDDDEGDAGEDDLNALASVGIFQGDGAGRVAPGDDLSRRQMANILLRHLQVLLADGDIRGAGDDSGGSTTTTSSTTTSSTTTSSTSSTTTTIVPPGNAAPTSVFARMTTAAGNLDVFDNGDVVQILFSEPMAPPAAAASVTLYDTIPVLAEATIVNGDNAVFGLNTAPLAVPGSGGALHPIGTVLTIQLLDAPNPGPAAVLDPTLSVPATIRSATGITDQSGAAWNTAGSPDTQVER